MESNRFVKKKHFQGQESKIPGEDQISLIFAGPQMNWPDTWPKGWIRKNNRAFSSREWSSSFIGAALPTGGSHLLAALFFILDLPCFFLYYKVFLNNFVIRQFKIRKPGHFQEIFFLKEEAMNNKDEIRILVVDDDAVSRTLVGASLEKFGYLADRSEGIETALKLLENSNYTIVITDKNMPDSKGEGNGGMELLKQCRIHFPSSEVIMMTAYGSVETAIEAMKLGAFDYLLKPVSQEELKGKIERIMEYKGFINPQNAIQIYKTLHNQILTLFESPGQRTDEEVHKLLRFMDKEIDHFFQAQKQWERIVLLQRESLGRIAICAEQLQEEVEPDSPYTDLIQTICEEAARRI